MIRVNLIAVANDRNVSSAAIVKPQFSSSATSAQKKKTLMTALAAVAFVVVACTCYVVVFGVPSFLSSALPESALDAAGMGNGEAKAGSLAAKRAAIAEAKAKAARTLPVIVDEVQPVMFVDKNAKRVAYKDFYPLEKMQYQKVVLGQLMSFLQTATPENTGFAEVVYEAPNYYFIHGTTDAPVSQRAFIERLRAVSLDFKSPKVSKEDENVTEITAFGTLRVDNIQFNPEVKQFIGAEGVNAEIAKLKKIEGLEKISFSGFEKPVKVENFGVYKRYTYNVRTLSNFVQLNAFIAAWKASDVRIGISRATFARSGKDVSASFTVDMFVTP